MRALVLVDLQNDFMPGGALAVPDGDAVVPVANRLMPRFDLVVATKDWHPPHHGSFASNHPGRKPGEFVHLDGVEQILWPDHCVEDTAGAEFHPDLDQDRIHRVFRKGTNPLIDSYSALYDNAHRQSTGLGEWLSGQGVDEILMLGLATDYCVKYSALDAAEAGFRVAVIEDGCRGIELSEGDVEAALDEMRAAGVEIVKSEEVE
jgi:nicotinamidase/pyrazinamidase